MNVAVLAFGFSYGLPPDLDLLFDVRFLRNPNYEPQLQPLTGADPAAAAFIEGDPALQPFLTRLFALLDFLLPHYAQTARAQLTIGFGCTGGRHRSVYVARRVLAHLEADPRWSAELFTRDVER
ncbi:MAG TPA: RNase adapter RapZ [Candidatus Tyrphobacter sp.]